MSRVRGHSLRGISLAHFITALFAWAGGSMDRAAIWMVACTVAYAAAEIIDAIEKRPATGEKGRGE